MMTPPSVREVTTSSSGTVPSTTASEWYRVARERLRHPVEERRCRRGATQRGLAVHQLLGVGDGRAERLGDRLVAEADAEQRDAGGDRRVHDRDRDAGGRGRARARGQQHAVVLGDALGRVARRRTRRCARTSVSAPSCCR